MFQIFQFITRKNNLADNLKSILKNMILII